MPRTAVPALVRGEPAYFGPDGDTRVTPDGSWLVSPIKHTLRDHVGYSSVAGGWSEEIVVERWTIPPGEWPEVVLARHRLAVIGSLSPVSAWATVDGCAVERMAIAGDIRVMPQGVAAQSRWHSQWDVAAFDFSSTLMERLLDGHAPDPSEQLIPQTCVRDLVAYDLGRRIVTELARPTERLYGEMLCLALAMHVLRRYGRTGVDAIRFKGRLSPIQARRTLEHMRANLESGVSVSELAREAGLSDAHFARAFRATFGEPPHRLMLRWRLQRAQRLIVQQGMRASEAAAAAGFFDQAHLTHAMRQHFGTTPGRLCS